MGVIRNQRPTIHLPNLRSYPYILGLGLFHKNFLKIWASDLVGVDMGQAERGPVSDSAHEISYHFILYNII